MNDVKRFFFSFSSIDTHSRTEGYFKGKKNSIPKFLHANLDVSTMYEVYDQIVKSFVGDPHAKKI